MKQLKIVTIFSLLLLTPKIHAEINMKDASYQISNSDIRDIRRTYNSRSLYTGYFGFGWCSSIEKSLTINNNKEIRLKDCDTDSPFVLTDESNSLKTRAFINPATKEKVIFKNGAYTQYLQNGEIRIFNRTGQLTSELREDQSYIAIEYENELPVRLKNSNSTTLQFSFNDTNQITHIESGDKQALYLYEKENLIQSVNFNNQSYLYGYDELNNMIRHTYPDKFEETVAYNNDYDRVLKIHLKNDCIEYYDFITKSTDPLHQVSTLTRKCDSKTVHQYIYEFWYKERTDGLKYLERYKIKQNTQTLDITYHPLDGSPTRIIKNGIDLFKI